ncbi:hypothetical protein WA158_006132 [Blastocystis sp. Blastoise]
METLSKSQINSLLKFLEPTHENIVFAAPIDKFHKRKDKIEKRIIVLTPYRLLSFKSGFIGGLTLARSGSLLNLTNVTYTEDFKISFELGDWKIAFTVSDHRSFVGLVVEKYNECSLMLPEDQRCTFILNSSSQDLLQRLTNSKRPQFTDEEYKRYIQGMIMIYRCVCSDMEISPNTQIEEELSDIYERAMSEFKLDGEGKTYDGKQCCAMISTLQYDNWFHELYVDNIPAGESLYEGVGRLISHSSMMSRLILRSINATTKAFTSLSRGFTENTLNRITYLDISNNILTTETLELLIPSLPSLHFLILEDCKMSPSSSCRFFQLLSTCPLLTKSLVKLDVSGNNLNVEGSEALANWLINRTPTQLKQLDMARASLYFSPIIEALSGDEIQISSIDISGNLIDETAYLSVNPFIATGKINTIGLGDMRNRLQYVEGVLASVLLNPNVPESTICLNNNNFPIDLYQRLVSLFSVSMNLKDIYIKNCNLNNQGLDMLCTSLLKCSHNHIKTLCIDNNIKVVEVGRVSESLSQLIELSPCLSSISIAGNKGISMVRLSQALSKEGSNLVSINISDCDYRDDDIILLANSLKQNKMLRSIRWDNNIVSIKSFQAMYDLVNNYNNITDMGYIKLNKEVEKNLLQKDIREINTVRKDIFNCLWNNQCIQENQA